MSAFIRLRLHILALLALAAVIAGQFGSFFWPAELFSHFLPHYAAVFILAAIWPRPKWRALWLVCAAASLLWLAQPFALPDAPADGTRLVWYNVHLDNPAAETGGVIYFASEDWEQKNGRNPLMTGITAISLSGNRGALFFQKLVKNGQNFGAEWSGSG